MKVPDRLDTLTTVVVNNLSEKDLLYYIVLLDTSSKTRFSEKVHNKDLQLPLLLALLIDDEKYWERSCHLRQWGVVHFWIFSCSWKNTYISLYAEDLIDNFICGKISFTELETTLLHLKDFLTILKLNGFKFKYYQINNFEANGRNRFLEDYISEILPHFRNLSKLHFNNIPINYDLTLDIEERGSMDRSVEKLCQSISNLYSLKEVTMLGTYMTGCLIEQLMLSLRPLSNLIELNLSCDYITDEHCLQIATFLPSSKIEKLVLSRNNICNIGCYHFAKTIPFSAVKTVFLDHNGIGDEGALALFSALLSHPMLLKLDMSYNDITGKATKDVCELIAGHPALEYLNISGNFLGENAGPKLWQALNTNSQIKFFGHSSCGFSEDDEDEICKTVNQHQNHI